MLVHNINTILYVTPFRPKVRVKFNLSGSKLQQLTMYEMEMM